MLNKLAQIATLLDSRGLYREADAITGVLIRIANEFVDDDTEHDPYGMDKGEVYPEHPDFMSWLSEKDPDAHKDLKGIIGEAPPLDFTPDNYPEVHKFGPVSTRWRKGMGKGKIKSDLLSRILLTPEQRRHNEERARKTYEGRDRSRPNRFEGVYYTGSESADPLASRSFITHPDYEDKLSTPPKGQEGRMGVFDEEEFAANPNRAYRFLSPAALRKFKLHENQDF